MSTVVGIWIALSGVLPVIVGLSARHRVSRLRRCGVKTWARVMPCTLADGGSGLALQYTLADGRVLEKLTPAKAGKRTELRPGQSVLVWYDAADPGDILIYGRWGRVPDLVLMLTGVAFVLCGAGIAVFAS